VKTNNPYPGNVRRTGERLMRMHYDLYDISRRLKAAGLVAEGGSVADIARKMGDIGSKLDEKVRSS